MKYLVLLGDGMADLPLPEYNDKTPLEIACKPTMDNLAKKSVLGMVRTVPDTLSPGSDVANLSVLGYDPKIYYTGRSPLEAASIGVALQEGDITFRCNLVTLSEEETYEDKTMIDYSADEISTEEAGELLAAVSQKFGSEEMQFYRGFSYRHLLVWHRPRQQFHLTPPHDISDRKITDYLPNVERFRTMMKESYELLDQHPVNQHRRARGLRPANSIWLWGEGSKPSLTSFTSKYNLKGSVISAVDLVKGLGVCAKMHVVEVAGATGNIDTNFEGKAQAAIQEFKNGADFVYLHFEAPDECGHRGEVENKIKSIEYLDQRVLKYLLKELKGMGTPYSILITPDHPTPLSLKTHTREAVPFMIYRSNDEKDHSDAVYTEKAAKQSSNYITDGYRLMDTFLL